MLVLKIMLQSSRVLFFAMFATLASAQDRPSYARAMEDTVNKGRVAFLGIALATPITGGLPIVIGGKIAGAIGVSDVTSDQDEQVAKAGLDGLK